MSKRKLEHDLVALMPRARRYGRALVGDTNTADALLIESTIKLIKHAPSYSRLTPTNMVLPWLVIELHKLIDDQHVESEESQERPPDRYESLLYEQIDSGLATLTDVQKRVYLLTALERFDIPVTAHIVGHSVEYVMEQFQLAHKLVHEYVHEHFAPNAVTN